MWIIAFAIVGILLLAGLGRALYKGQYNSLRNFLVTMFFLDLVFDDWYSDLGIEDIDF